MLSFLICAAVAYVLRGRNRSMSLLSLVCLSVGVLLAFELFYSGYPWPHNPLFSTRGIVGASFAVPLAFACPLEFMRPNWLSWRRAFVIFLGPMLLAMAVHVTTSVSTPLPTLTTYAQVRQYIHYPEMLLRIAIVLFVLAEAIVLGVYTHRQRRRHVARIAADLSYTKGADLGWIRITIGLYVLYGVAVLVGAGVEGLWPKVFFSVVMTFCPIVNVMLCAGQTELYAPGQFPHDEYPGGGNGKPAPDETSKPPVSLKERLLELFEEDEVYTDPGLSLGKVAALLNTNRTYLSKTINESLGTTFYTLVNDYRVRKAVELVRDPALPEEKVSQIAKQAGFNSASSFYKLFKEHTGRTPKQMRGDVQNGHIRL